MDYENLDATTRRLMSFEFYYDLDNNKLKIPLRLNARGRILFPVALENAIERGDSSSLAENIREDGMVREVEEGLKNAAKIVPWNAADLLSVYHFNNFYMRGVCRLATERKVKVQVYRARDSAKPRVESTLAEGEVYDPQELLTELREHRCAVGVIGSGLSLRLKQ